MLDVTGMADAGARGVSSRKRDVCSAKKKRVGDDVKGSVFEGRVEKGRKEPCPPRQIACMRCARRVECRVSNVEAWPVVVEDGRLGLALSVGARKCHEIQERKSAQETLTRLA